MALICRSPSSMSAWALISFAPALVREARKRFGGWHRLLLGEPVAGVLDDDAPHVARTDVSEGLREHGQVRAQSAIAADEQQRQIELAFLRSEERGVGRERGRGPPQLRSRSYRSPVHLARPAQLCLTNSTQR
jgi:hypothetical protein